MEDRESCVRIRKRKREEEDRTREEIKNYERWIDGKVSYYVSIIEMLHLHRMRGG